MGMKKCVFCKIFFYSINCYRGNENSFIFYFKYVFCGGN